MLPLQGWERPTLINLLPGHGDMLGDENLPLSLADWALRGGHSQVGHGKQMFLEPLQLLVVW